MIYSDYDWSEGYVPEDEEITDEQKLEWFKEGFIRDKENLLGEIMYARKHTADEAKKDTRLPAAYYAVLDKLFEKLIAKIEDTCLFKELEDWWAYSYTIGSEGAALELQHFSSVDFDKEGRAGFTDVDSFFELIRIPCKLLTVDDFAKLYNVEQGTIRQWIRRGKIRTAKKYGNEWRIPELTALPGRGYSFGQYEWKDDLTDVPEQYEQFRRPAVATFDQSRKDPKVFHVSLSRKDEDLVSFEMDVKEREKLELFLIAHPMVKFISDIYASWG